MKLVLASNNAKKLGELREILAPAGWELIAQGELGVSEAEEPYATFVENALAKARHAARATGLPALADDSGLCVDALGGAPGVHSARYAGEPKSDARNNEKLLAELAQHSNGDASASRRARFVCVIVFVRSADDPQPLIAEGEWIGEILTAPTGGGGFGYDPLLWIAECQASVAELPAAEKHRRSHRGQALARLLERLRERG
ncbi:RdgB/HAM1 family non-canonical purine NTP pyrophosphatase [Rhodocyclus tenuis]|uniref:dITP/XTP pyrophosphatase n=1 Tax=Rhodocyclus gracilis TaxID=2929842 RepID=A0ABX0WHP7_9RHOO|nr:RdgB/HAM1 family non-canonical purine NTP pyrophosphatase [Rhodocyclus gracilis]MRD72129.1 RdgB/HAM1 family non-canonical purine NTP pyrophosphatase [Rhodocyclus gracilis]NJA89234.1 RdgB/HAM1 family non-canonical purine NTP pyrophosphatase [Rhodocyclus gracilis]